ncbi:Fur family transcriptional regulator [Konateibacter massiliensis]|uniref:Fur family transcriptional regulator n=1 Tax=Konateibacter massiliensis TaxID=2002841 RepID=UPI000C1601E6|nr:transcriptional repressor [Konateibacter massiliensis]
MQTLKYSRQREAIKEFLMSRTDHPTADTVYTNIRQEFPNISLGTVYRNLSLLSDIGEILKISTGEGGDRFDANTAPHYHFICTKCNSVIDLEMEGMEHINELASANFSGQITGHTAHFYGTCENCINKH